MRIGHMYHSIRPGREWLDTKGKPIQAHGFFVCYQEKEQQWIWYGENKEETKKGGTIWTKGIRWYTSRDLYNWEDRGLLIPPSGDLYEPLHPTYCIDRPHIIYCPNTGKYVCWIKIMAGEIAQFMTVLQADRFEGPYETVHRFYNPLHMYTGDFTLHADSETGKGYIWYDRPHFQLICATLSDTYTEVTEEYSVHYDGRRPPLTREAPVYFEREGKKYLFTSGTSGYYPNKSDVCILHDYHGEYESLGDPCIGDKTDTTFNSQITCVIRIPGTDHYIALADRWMPQWYIPKMARAIQSGMERHFKDYVPDMSPKDITSVPGKLQHHSENTFKSRYVWLPVEWEGNKPVIRWRKEWTVDEL